MEIALPLSNVYSLLSLKPSMLYYMKNGCHRSLQKTFELICAFFFHITDLAKIPYETKDVIVTEMFLQNYIWTNFSSKQYFYIYSYNDGTILQMIASFLKCQKIIDIFRSKSNVTFDKTDIENIIQYVSYIGDIVIKCNAVLLDPLNKSHIFKDISKFYSGVSTSVTLENLNRAIYNCYDVKF